jgi:hypothetical protein
LGESWGEEKYFFRLRAAGSRHGGQHGAAEGGLRGGGLGVLGRWWRADLVSGLPTTLRTCSAAAVWVQGVLE